MKKTVTTSQTRFYTENCYSKTWMGGTAITGVKMKLMSQQKWKVKIFMTHYIFLFTCEISLKVVDVS